jgi:elongation factor P
MGRGTGNIKVKCRNLITGAFIEKTFTTGAKVEPVQTQTKNLTFLYQDDQQFVFMDPRSYEQYSIPQSVIEQEARFLTEGAETKVQFWDEQGQLKPLTVQFPPKLVFTIKQTAPGVKGDSASNVYKDAVLDNDMKIRVPLFINQGEQVRVDTRTGDYIERVKK